MPNKKEKKAHSKEEPCDRAGSSAFMAPLTPDAALAEVVGKDPLPRTEITKKVWDYVRENNLQDPKDRRTIRADAKLKRVFDGKGSVTMFELTKMVNVHLRPYSSPPGGATIKRSRSVDGDHTTDYDNPKKPGKR